jgi:hypothetical protein
MKRIFVGVALGSALFFAAAAAAPMTCRAAEAGKAQLAAKAASLKAGVAAQDFRNATSASLKSLASKLAKKVGDLLKSWLGKLKKSDKDSSSLVTLAPTGQGKTACGGRDSREGFTSPGGPGNGGDRR